MQEQGKTVKKEIHRKRDGVPLQPLQVCVAMDLQTMQRGSRPLWAYNSDKSSPHLL